MSRNLFALTSIIVAFTSTLYGQDITTAKLRWNSTQIFNTITGNLAEAGATILTHGKSHVTVSTEDGIPKSFTVNDVLGNWINVSKDGEVVYGIGNDEEDGTITFIRKEGEIKVQLLLIKADVPELYEFKISNIQVIN